MILFRLESPYGTLAGVGIRSEDKRPVYVNKWDVIVFQKDGKIFTTFGLFFPILW